MRHLEFPSATPSAPDSLAGAVRSDGFGRMFPDMRLWVPAGNTDDARKRALADFAAAHMQPKKLHSRTPAGYTYFGQFVSHDLNFDAASTFDAHIQVSRLRNFRTPALDLDSLYRGGPRVSPYLYRRSSGGRATGFFDYAFRDVDGIEVFDLPRNHAEVALIGDARNDETVVIAQLHLAFLRFHNAVLERVVGGGEDTRDHFDEARRIVRWTYQYVAWNDWLRNLIPRSLFRETPRRALDDAPAGLRAMGQHGHKLPVEFSFGAMRFGHSMVREKYDLNEHFDSARQVPLFAADGRDLRGGRALMPEHMIQWNWFVDVETDNERTAASVSTSTVRRGHVRKARKINPNLSDALSQLPHARAGALPLAEINLRRSWLVGLPHAAEVAERLGEEGPTSDSFASGNLWYFTLFEAQRFAEQAPRESEATTDTRSALEPPENDGAKLGPVGARIVMQTIAEVLDFDGSSYCHATPGWTPAKESVLKHPKIDRNDWQLRDILRFAGVPIHKSDLESR